MTSPSAWSFLISFQSPEFGSGSEAHRRCATQLDEESDIASHYHDTGT